MTLQDEFQRFLDPNNQPASGMPIPELDNNLVKKIIKRVDAIKWYLNRYSLELNFKHANISILEFKALAREWGFDGAQLHVAKGGPHTCLSGESDDDLRTLAEQEGKRKLDLQLDVSSVDKAEIEDIVRVARAMEVKIIRCYVREGGTLNEIIETAKERLTYAVKLGNKWGIDFLLEQHELLTGPEMVEIVSSVNSLRLGILFDFANPITAGRDPLDDLTSMSKYIRGCHCKDVRIFENDGYFSQQGVRMGNGDLNLPKLIFDLLMLGDNEPQVEYFSIQMVVDYYASGIRTKTDKESRIFEKRLTSDTKLSDELSETRLKERLRLERDYVKEGLEYCKSIVSELRSIASEYVLRQMDMELFFPIYSSNHPPAEPRALNS